MRCAADQVQAFLREPDPTLSGALIHGTDPALAAECRRRLVRSVLGDLAGDDFYQLILDPGEVQRDAGSVHAALTARTLLPGRRVALLDSATHLHTRAIARALADPDPEDAFLIVVAGELKPQSTLRKLFESADRAMAVAAEARPPEAAELRRRFAKAGLPEPTPDALDRLLAVAREMSWGEFQTLFEKLRLYVRSDAEEVSLADVDACAPPEGTVQVDQLVDAVAGGDMPEIARLLRALASRGILPVSILIPLTLQFLHMHRALATTRGARGARGLRTALGRQPMHPARREALARHCGRWTVAALEAALAEFHRADLALRFRNAPAPAAVLERALMRAAGRRPRAGRTREGTPAPGRRR